MLVATVLSGVRHVYLDRSSNGISVLGPCRIELQDLSVIDSGLEEVYLTEHEWSATVSKFFGDPLTHLLSLQPAVHAVLALWSTVPHAFFSLASYGFVGKHKEPQNIPKTARHSMSGTEPFCRSPG